MRAPIQTFSGEKSAAETRAVQALVELEAVKSAILSSTSKSNGSSGSTTILKHNTSLNRIGTPIKNDGAPPSFKNFLAEARGEKNLRECNISPGGARGPSADGFVLSEDDRA